MRGGLRALLALAALLFTAALPAASLDAGPRVALVIGNAGYRNAPLANPLNDSRAMADTLRKLGFKVVSLENASQKQMYDAVRQFGDGLQGGVGLFYYAGHGVQVKGRNYLVPVDADIEREDEVPYKAFDVSQVLAKMEAAHNPLNIVILDACRNNPFAHGARGGGGGGLAQMDAPTGSIVAFATAPGAEAADGTSGNGLYTSQLLRFLSTPGLKVEDVFKRTRVAVKQASGGRQIPWESTSLEGDFYFAAGSAGAPAPTVNLDDEMWQLVADTGQPSAYQAYLQKFPNGSHAAQARSLAQSHAPAPAARNADSGGSGFSFSAEEAKMDAATPQGREQAFQQQLASLSCSPQRRHASVKLALDEPRGGGFGAALAQRLQQAGLKVGTKGDYVVRGTVSTQANPHPMLRVNEVVLSTALTMSTPAGQQVASSMGRDESYAGSDVGSVVGELVRQQAGSAALALVTQLCQP
jgi:uncharacterized caspase-like protein